jgi:hypothetical protein
MTDIPWDRFERLAWATSERERDTQIERAQQLEGQRIKRVQYFTLDYSQMDHNAARVISDEDEWSNPSWRYDYFDSFDFFLQIATEDQRCFTIGWDLPGDTDGLWLIEGGVSGESFGSIAVWDVTATPRWTPLMGSVVTSVEYRYRAEQSLGGWSNELITMTIDEQRIYVFLGGIDADHSPTPSADDLMVMSAPTALPDWIAN